MTDLSDDPTARQEKRPSLRRRFMLTFGVLFVVGAVVLRLIHYSTTATAPNAIEHGATGDRIEVVLVAEATRCRMAVIDHGPGVPVLALPKLFDRFHSGKASGGHGIGLALSRRIARSHGGDLVHEATPGGGATFVLFLPSALEPS